MEAILYRENHPACVGKEPVEYYTVRRFLEQQAGALELEHVL